VLRRAKRVATQCGCSNERVSRLCTRSAEVRRRIGSRAASVGQQMSAALLIPVGKPDGFRLRYILGKFRETASAHGVDWSLPASTSEWSCRLLSSCHISATSSPAAVADGHFFLPELFHSSHTGSTTVLAGTAALGFPGSFKLVRAKSLRVLIEGKPASITDIAKSAPLSEWNGEINRGTWILAAPIDCNGVARPELAVAVTAGELCLLKTRDLVYNLIGDKWNTGEDSILSSPLFSLLYNLCGHLTGAQD
jgi:hypothetical protein